MGLDKNIERDLVNYLFFELNKQKFIVVDEIFEYDVQYYIHSFLKFKFKNTRYKVKREKQKTDHIIEKYDHKNKLVGETFIELKSFIKKHERLNYKKIISDINKLNESRLAKNDYYFLIAVKEKHLSNKSNKYKKLIECLNNANLKKFTFENGAKKIDSRIIRSFNTSYFIKDKLTRNNKDSYIKKFHKSQIRVFMFQLLNNK